jgi:hypothetical protein
MHGYPGSYAGVVLDTADPQAQHRLLVQVPAVLDVASVWAEASLPADGSEEPTLPSVGDQVNVTFEGGDTERPVWYAGPVDPTPATHGYIGTYRAVVVDTQDPQQANRVAVQLASLGVEQPLWAMPGVELGSEVVLPAVGAAVWVTFDEGALEYPVWVGLA